MNRDGNGSPGDERSGGVRVGRVMDTDVAAVDPSVTVARTAVLMRDRPARAVVVVDDAGGFHGIVSDRDLVTRVLAPGEDPHDRTLGEICSKSAASVTVDDDAVGAVRVMSRHEVPRLPVTSDGSVVGIITLDDAAEQLDLGSLVAAIGRPRRLSER